jgi:hypothetical protein
MLINFQKKFNKQQNVNNNVIKKHVNNKFSEKIKSY